MKSVGTALLRGTLILVNSMVSDRFVAGYIPELMNSLGGSKLMKMVVGGSESATPQYVAVGMRYYYV